MGDGTQEVNFLRLGWELAYQPNLRYARHLAYRLFGTLDVRARLVAYHLLPFLLRTGEQQIILDAGCGIGLFTFLLARRLPRSFVIGVDSNPTKIAACQAIKQSLKIPNVEFHCTNLETLNVDTLDAVLCVDVLEHVADDSAVLAAIWHALKLEGYLFLHTPLAKRHDQRLFKRWHSYFRRFTADDPVLQRYDEKSLYAKIAKANFQILECRFTYGFWGELAWELDALAAAKGFPARVIMMPFVTAMMALDTRSNNVSFHNGILIVAQKVKSAVPDGKILSANSSKG